MDSPINPKACHRRIGLRIKLGVSFGVLLILMVVLSIVANARKDLSYDILAQAAVLAIFAMLSYAISFQLLIKPFLVLQEQMSGFGKTDLVSRVDLKTGDEFEQAAVSFNEMTERINDLVSTVQRRATELEAVLSTMPYGVYVCDAKGDMTFINDYGMKMLGIGQRAMLPRRVEELDRGLNARPLVGDSTEGETGTTDPAVGRTLDAACPLARALRGEAFAGTDFSYWNPWLGHEQYIRVSGAPICNALGDKVGAVIVASDVTGQIETNRRREEMVYVTSHELRAPLANIRGYIQLAMRQLADDIRNKDVTGYLDQANRQVNSMVDLINRLLDVSRIDTGHLNLEKQDFDMVALVADVIDRMQTTSEKHRLRLFMTDEQIVLKADPARIEQVLLNLIANAIKYSPDGGNVDVRVSKVGSMVVVSVKDSGIGIPQDKQNRIFEKLYRVETEKTKGLPGTGLGLFVSRGIIEAHGGEIHFESEDGQGATFYFMLPTT